MVGTTPSSNPCHDLAREALSLLLDHPEDFHFNPDNEAGLTEFTDQPLGQEDFCTFAARDKGAFWRCQPTTVPHANIVLNAFRAAKQGWLNDEVALDVGETYQESLLYQLEAIKGLEMPATQLRALEDAYEMQLDGLERLVEGDVRGYAVLSEGTSRLRQASDPASVTPSMACCACGKSGPQGHYCQHCSAKQPRWLAGDSGSVIDIQENAVALVTGPVVLKVLEAIEAVEGCK